MLLAAGGAGQGPLPNGQGELSVIDTPPAVPSDVVEWHALTPSATPAQGDAPPPAPPRGRRRGSGECSAQVPPVLGPRRPGARHAGHRPGRAGRRTRRGGRST